MEVHDVICSMHIGLSEMKICMIICTIKDSAFGKLSVGCLSGCLLLDWQTIGGSLVKWRKGCVAQHYLRSNGPQGRSLTPENNYS